MENTQNTAQLTQRMTIGDFLLRRLGEAGIRHLFGVPGDYNLMLLQQLHDSGALEWVGTTGELTSSYAADGYARLTGLGALLVTNGVGALSALNGVAGAFAEHIPVICISGSIPLRSIDRGLGMHHTMADGNFDHFLRAYAPVTVAQARITPRNAVVEIDRLILTAWREKLPVYMELPSDIAYLEIEAPAAPLVLAHAPGDPERLQSCIAALAQQLSSARSPAILVDTDADRFGVVPELVALAEKLQAPLAVINAAKGVIDESHPQYVGIYAGKGSEPGVREAIESSDCLLAVGYRPIEVTTGDFTATLPARTIHARAHAVDVGEDNYQAVTLKEVLRGVVDVVPQVATRVQRPVEAPVARTRAEAAAKLTQAAYWQAVQDYLRPADVLYVDNGTSFSLLGLKLPPGCTFIGSINWGSIGYSVGALLGALTAAPERRHVLLIGDGSFQVTAQELSTILHHDHKPAILLINNGGYTIERGYIGKTEPYNDIANWSYADLPKVLHPGASAQSFVARTCGDLQNALAAPNDQLIFVESIMDPCDAPAPILHSSNVGAELDYGPRGPQQRDNLQLRPGALAP
ncbi:alpha-keto acid decarboxylase family protein [Paraburkholderia silviterrae]|uniref:Alpha-keto acid decarboxylase family protein n=1 Tax=Paraburkholderia silviterrae TaxID=2528715 RepID=A0A4R5M0U4_9BURK|nr:thiamine pyrophosphate-binding protein [Paraburkholderia silviterrae]TDG18768.1 alpha-keto acid decarboxylase family protein [Paraburkholderia silviterrae]